MRPHTLFSTLALAEFMLAVFPRKAPHVINLHDAYLVVEPEHVRVGLGVLALLFAATYWLMHRVGRPLPQHLGLVHFLMMVLGVVLPAGALTWADRMGTVVPATLILIGAALVLVGALIMFAGLILSITRYRGRLR